MHKKSRWRFMTIIILALLVATAAHSEAINIIVAGDNTNAVTAVDDTTVAVVSGATLTVATDAITFTGDNNRLINIGSVTGTDTGLLVVYDNDAGTTQSQTVINAGSITGETGISFCTNPGTYPNETGVQNNDLVDNYGTIISTGAGATKDYAAIQMGGGDDILNNYEGAQITGAVRLGPGMDHFSNWGALISTDMQALATGDGDDSVVNYGAITVTDSAECGISTADGNDTFTNHGTINIISTSCSGITMGDGHDFFNNTGAVTIADLSEIGMNMAGGNDSFTNSGTFSIASAGTHGLHLACGDDVFTNSGTFTIGTTGSNGVHLADGDDTFTNSGTFSIGTTGSNGVHLASGDDVFTNSGTFSIGTTEDGHGINMADGDNIFVNSGYLSLGDIYSHGVMMADGDDTFTNSGTFSIASAGSHGFHMGDGDNIFTNSNTFSIGDTSSHGIQMAGGNDTFTNSGSITIDNAGSHGINIGCGNDTITNTGSLTIGTVGSGYAGIYLGDGDDVLISRGALNLPNIISIDGGLGTDTIQLGGTAALGIDGDILDIEHLIKTDSGIWTLNGDDINITVTVVEAGLLNINGIYTDSENLTIEAGGTLGGNGSISANGGVYNSGAVAPGASIGTLTIASGDYIHQGQAVLEIEADAGTCDLLAVSETATINGGSVNVTPVGIIQDGSEYTVLTAGTLYGAFDAVTDTSYVLNFTPVYTSTDLTLTAGRTSYADAYSDQGSLGQILDQAFQEGLWQDTLLLLDQASSAAEFGALLNAIGPVDGANLSDISFDNMGQFQGMLMSRLGDLQVADNAGSSAIASLTESGPVVASVPANGMGAGLWMEAFGVNAEQDDDGPISGYDYDTRGITLGVDNAVADNLVLGIGIGMAGGDVDYANNLAKHEIDSTHISVYAAYTMDQIRINSAVSYADNCYDTDRVIPGSGVLTSDHGGSDIALNVNVGYPMDMDGINVIPSAGLEYAIHDEDGYAEVDGTGATVMLVDSGDTDSLKTRLGVAANKLFGSSDGTQILGQARLQWAHEFGDTEREVTGRFAGSAASFTVQGVEPDADTIVLGLDMGVLMSEALTVNLSLDTEWRDGFSAYGLAAGLKYNF